MGATKFRRFFNDMAIFGISVRAEFRQLLFLMSAMLVNCD
jgi:hypothetical protein